MHVRWYDVVEHAAAERDYAALSGANRKHQSRTEHVVYVRAVAPDQSELDRGLHEAALLQRAGEICGTRRRETEHEGACRVGSATTRLQIVARRLSILGAPEHRRETLPRGL